jgi:hypothetical protein
LSAFFGSASIYSNAKKDPDQGLLRTKKLMYGLKKTIFVFLSKNAEVNN